MIKKSLEPGTRVRVDAYGDEGKLHPLHSLLHNAQGRLISKYSHHVAGRTGDGREIKFWGYFVRLDDNRVIGISRRNLSLPTDPPSRFEPAPKMDRSEIDSKVSWDDCAWKPVGMK